MRYLLLDRILECKKFEYATGVKCISMAEDCFEHHFPGQPVFPGALLIESMAQLGGALLELSLREQMDYMPRCVVSTVKAKFRNFAVPGDALQMRAEILSRREESAQVKVSCTQPNDKDRERICDAEMIFVYLKVEDPVLERSRQELLKILTRDTLFVDEST